MSKILTLPNLVSKVKSLKASGKKVCHCHGCFDLVHYGHIKLFEASKAHGDILIVTVTPDRFIKKGPGRPAFDEKKRLRFLSELECIDFVALNDAEDAIELSRSLKPDITFRGKEYEDPSKDITGKISLEKKAIESVGGKLQIIDEEVHSSTHLINNLSDIRDPAQQEYIDLIRKKKVPEKALEFLDKVKSKKVLNIGEIIIDEYVYTSVRGTVTKHPIISASYNDTLIMAGGSLATSRHLSSLVNKPELLSSYGSKNPEYLDFIKNSLKSSGVRSKIIKNIGDFSVVKTRFISSSGYPNPLSNRIGEVPNKTSETRLFELGYIPMGLINESTERKIIDFLKKNIKLYDLVIISDFGHGLMTPQIIDFLIRSAKKLSINTQTNSTNFGFNLLSKYKKGNFFCVDELEARLLMSDRRADIDSLARKIMRKMNTQSLMISRGKYGLRYYKNNSVFNAPALANKVVDPIGAGDSLFIGASLASCFQEDPYVTGFISAVMGMLGTSIQGNERPISKDEIIRSIKGIV